MAKDEDARASAGLAASDGDWGLARCGRPPRRGTPCKRTPVAWRSDWPEPQEPGACYVHMPDTDRRAQVRHIAADERKFARKRDQAEPACWSWLVPATGTGSGMDTLLPGTDGWEFLANWQDGRCAICGSSPKALVTDHDHLIGLVRGLLCHSCNAVEGHTGEGGKGIIASYRLRHPAMILGLTVPYVDPWTGQVSEHRTEGFDPWQDTPPGNCWRCYAGPSQPCECLPAFRLNPRSVLTSILAVFLTARAVGIKDARRMYGGYISDPLHRAADHFVRDLLLRP